jgi:hypothetical protein
VDHRMVGTKRFAGRKVDLREGIKDRRKDM